MSGHIDSVLSLLNGGLRVGPARSHGGLALVPLFGGRPGGEYLVGAEAFASGLLTVSEVDGGSVPEILADNRAQVPVLLLEGEHLQGARQDRVLNVSVLLAAGRTTVIPVSCVEQGRWHYREDKNFAPMDVPFAPATLRARKSEAAAMSARAGTRYRADQGEVWEEVRRVGQRLGSFSPTMALGDAMRGRRGELEAMLAAFPGPEEGQTGVVACVGGRPVAVDAFDRPETLAAVWSRLVGGYATDALGVAAAEPSEDAVRRFMTAAAGGQATSHEGVGEGMQVIVTSGAAVATALTWDHAVVHLAVLGRPHSGAAGQPFQAPSARARRWFQPALSGVTGGW